MQIEMICLFKKKQLTNILKKKRQRLVLGVENSLKKIEMIVMLKSGKIVNLFVISKKLNVWQYLWFCCLFVLGLGNFLFLA